MFLLRLRVCSVVLTVLFIIAADVVGVVIVAEYSDDVSLMLQFMLDIF